ncbi:MAG TPA: hypothetical protein VHT25_12670 [Solirubrobacteraceae bacterium]|nr:hypothetical protein [Solirubrobacteraceae bacterium]
MLQLRPLFPVDEVRALTADRAPTSEKPREGHVAPVAGVYGELDGPAIIIELAFWPHDGIPEPLAEQSWIGFCQKLGVAPFEGLSSLRSEPDSCWSVEFAPHTLITNPSRSFQLMLPRPDEASENAIRAAGSCFVIFGTGLEIDSSGAVGVSPTAAAITATYAGSMSVPELSEIPGLYVVPVNSFRPYDPIRATTFVLDTDVLIEIERFSFEPSRLGKRAEAIRSLLVNVIDRDVLPGLALSQLVQPSRTASEKRTAAKALAAFEHAMSLTRTEIMDPDRRPSHFDEDAEHRELLGLDEIPHIWLMYAGVLRLRQLWHPGQTLSERAKAFEAFVQWLRCDLRVNAGLLLQVAFNLWISNDEAQGQASRLLRFRAGAVSHATLGRLWGTAYDITLIACHAAVLQLPTAFDAVILTFDRGLAEMREFFEHVDTDEIPWASTRGDGMAWNSRARLEPLHPRLEHMRPRLVGWVEGLHQDAVVRLAQGYLPGLDDLRELVRVEEQQLLAGGKRT